MINSKRGKITIGFIIFIIVVLSIFILQTKITISASNNLSINQTIDKNIELNVMPAQPGKVGFGGVVRFPAQAKKPEEVTIQNITAEVKEQVGQVQVNISPVDETIKYNPEILEAFSNNSEIPVIVRLKDKSEITITGTKEERRNLLIQRDEWFKPVVDEFYASLSKNDFRGEKSNTGFDGFITKKGFETLLNDSRVKSISWAKRGANAILSESIPLINVDDVWNAGYNGSGAKVCVIDTGVNSTHPDLIGKIKDEHCYCRTPGDGFGFCCLPDHSSQNDNATDDNGHGTHVTGIVASQDSTYKGVGKGADVYVVKVLNSSGGGNPAFFWSDLGKAIDWCRINKSVDIVSISIGDGGNYPGSEPCPTLVDQQINDAYNVGISVIIASGNDGYTNGISYPACSPNAISVGATTKSDAIWSLTNRGSNLDLLAPGASIASLRYSPTKTPVGCNNINNEITVCSGTSMATPHVSGVAALLLDLNSTLTPSQIQTTLNSTGVNVGGFKRIDALAALNAIRDKDSDGYFDQAYGGTDCNDNNGAVNPGATETCDTIDNDCDSIIDEGCVNDCTVTGYEQCFESTFGDCKARIAINRYENVNTIRWGNVSDSNDPYVINEYKIGWKGDIAKKVYYGKKVNETCTYDGCNASQEVVIQGTKVTVTAPGIGHQDETLSYNQTPLNACWTWFYNFTPNYGSTNPIYVLKCFADSDCASGSYCNKTGTWNQWACVSKYADGIQCTQDSQCQSNYCDNDGTGLADDNWCFTPYNTYFDGQENTYCEYATDNGIADCDERQVNGSITSCTLSGQTYLGDRCTSSCVGEDSNICRSSGFASGCTADTECDGVTAGTGYCNLSCNYNPPPIIRILFPVNNNQYTSTTLDLNWTSNTTLASCYYLLDSVNYSNIICRANYSYSGFSFSVTTQDTSPEDVTKKGNNFYVLGRFNEAVYEYDSSGTYTGTSFSVSAQDTTPQGLTWNGSNFYMAGSATDKIYEYTSSGTYTGFSFSVASQDTDPTAITSKDGSFFVLGAATQRVYQYNSAGTYANFNFSVSSQDTVPEGIVWDGISFYVVGGITDKVYEYFTSGRYTGFNFSISAEDTNGKGITTNGSSFYVVGATGDKVYKYINNNAVLSNTTLNNLSIGNHNVTIYAKGSDGNTAQTNYTYFEIILPQQVASLKIDSLTELYSNETIRIFEFIVTNNGSGAIANVQWWFDTNNSYIINSTINISSLASGESAFVYLEYNFSSTGSFNTKANVSNGSLSDIKTFIVNISTAPVITSIPDITFNEDTYNDSLNLSNYVSDAEDPDSALTWTATNNVNVIVTINQTTKIANFTALANWSGSENIKFTVNDTSGLTANDTILVTVNPVNDAPTFNSSKQIPNMTWPEDVSNSSLNLSTYFYDIDGDTLNYTSTGTSNIIVHINNNTGIVNLTPNANWTGIDYVIFTAKDPAGLTASSNNVTLNVTPVNDAPTFTGTIPQWKWPEDVTNLSLNLTQYFSDIDGDALKYNFTSVSNITISINNNTGIVNFTPNQNFNGLRYVIFTAIDALNITISSNNVTLNLTPVNDPPTIDSYIPLNLKPSVVAGSNLTFNHTSSDIDGDSLSYSWKFDWVEKSTELGWVYNSSINELGTHNVTLNVSDGIVNVSMQWNVTVINQTNINVYDFSVLHQNSTLMIFGFSVNNTGTVNLTNINWTLNTGPETISANELFGLKPNESIFMFIEYAYPTTGDYNAIASATDGTYSDSESIAIEIEDIEVSNLSVVYANATERIFELIIKNFLNTNLTNVSWVFDTKNSDVINSTITTTLQPNEEMFVYIDYNFTTTGTFNVNASARNSTLADSRNLTIIIV